MDPFIALLDPADRPALIDFLSSERDFDTSLRTYYRRSHPPFEDFVAWDGDTIVGLLTANVRSSFAGNGAFAEFDLPAGRHSFLSRVYVAANRRRDDIGRALVRALAQHAASHGSTFIAGTIDQGPGLAGRRAFFTKCGFQITPQDQFGATTEDVLAATA